jgi:uncharacterized protein (TIGR02145 family)
MQDGVQGICPPGWHLPCDEEWKVLEGAADTHHGIGDQEWDAFFGRGYDAGINLKTQSGWTNQGNGNDKYGFSGLPGGHRWDGGGSYGINTQGFWWSTTEYFADNPIRRYLEALIPSVDRYFGTGFGFSVRCIMN